MKFLTYLQTDQATLDQYVNDRWVTVKHHDEFPLDLYCYGRTCQYEDKWDNITSRCRGIIVHRETGEIVARPFEKFHNYGSANKPETQEAYLSNLGLGVVWEKLDGFMLTLYQWEGQFYVASKGSFDSPHAKWATKWFKDHLEGKFKGYITPDMTFVFEGINPSLRIVVDYGKREEMVLTAIIKNETGRELEPESLEYMAEVLGASTPKRYREYWGDAAKKTLEADSKNEEGFVVTWYNKTGPLKEGETQIGHKIRVKAVKNKVAAPFRETVVTLYYDDRGFDTRDDTPTRVKLKYQEYLRLHRMVTGVSPKNIWEALRDGQSLSDWENGSTEWFAKFVKKWETALKNEFARIETRSRTLIKEINDKLKIEGNLSGIDYFAARKAFAIEFNRVENKEFAPVMFALLDNKDIKPIVWKMVKRLLEGSRAMRDAHAL